MQAAYTEESLNSKAFSLLGTVRPSSTATHLLSDNISLILSSSSSEGGFDTCSFYSGPSDSAILAFGESNESTGSIAYSGGSESCGSIAYSGGGESCGSVASASSSSSSCACSYSC